MSDSGASHDGPWFIPELHDISARPGCGPGPMLAMLPPRARDLAALLVVPDWGGRHPIRAGSSLARELSDLPGEKVLHGLSHLRGPSLPHRLLLGTDDEAEFATCREEDARFRLATATRIFSDALGALPSWFCAPRWSESAATMYVLREMPLKGLMHRSGYTVRSPSGDTIRRITIDAAWFDDGARWPPRLAGAARRILNLRRLLRERRPFRLVLHPRDLTYSTSRRAIRALVERLCVDGWEPRGLPAVSP